MRKLCAIGIMATVLTLISPPGWTMDYTNMTNDELAELRGAIQNAPESEREAFQGEWEIRLNNMSDEEKKQYSESVEPDPGEEQKLKQPYIPGRGYDNQGTGSVIYGGSGQSPQGGIQGNNR